MVVLGIDWGTTNSCISYYNSDSKQFVVIPNEQGDLISPSVISFDPEILCGKIARNLPNCLSKLKRLVGKDQLLKVKENVYLSVPQIICHYIHYLKDYATKFIGELDPIEAVITVPVYYNDHQREIIKNCFQECQINVLRIINEPTAAALAYAYGNVDVDGAVGDVDGAVGDSDGAVGDEHILVFDCGGGTTDLSLLYLEHSSQVYQVKNVIGDNFLGGEDITQMLFDYLCKGAGAGAGAGAEACEKLKCDLSFRENATFYYEKGETCYSRTVSRAQFLDITRPFFTKIKTLIRNLLNDAGCLIKLKKVIFVGGTTRIPYFKDLFREILGNDVIICCDLDPDCTVSLGAAVQGALIEESLVGDFSDTLLLDIIPLSIGVETVGGIMTPIISRNSILPISKTQDFTTSDSTIQIAVYQGERKFVKDNFLLAKFNIETICETETIVLSVSFDVSLDGIITASARIKGGEKIESIKIQNSVEFAVEQHLLDAEMSKISDSEKANQVIQRNELYDIFKKLLCIFHEHTSTRLDSEYIKNELNKLFNETFYIIEDFEKYTPSQLRECKKIFEETWHQLVFSGNVNEDNDTCFSSQIKDES
jgi:molecular chaperone DnaK